MKVKHRFVRTLLVALSAMLFSFHVSAQTAEHIVILWDVTGSLLPQESGVVDPYSGETLPAYHAGNGLFVPLKEAVIDCIEYVEEDPSTQITVIAFHESIRKRFSSNATKDGKADLVKEVKELKYVPHGTTNIVDPIKNFYSIVDPDKINYMFLFTDGDNDHPGTRPLFAPTLNAWESKAGSRNAFGFYVLVHKDADRQEVRDAASTQDNFWIVPDAKVRIKICTLPSVLKYNVRDDKGPKMVAMQGRSKNASGRIVLDVDDQYYDVICSDANISDADFCVEVKPKRGVNPPTHHVIMLTPGLEGADEYTFVGPQQVKLEVSNLPERSLNLVVENKNFGTGSYYDSFCGVSSRSVPVTTDIEVEFSDQAKKDNSSARMEVCLVDRIDGQEISFESQNLKLYINGEERTSLTLTPDMTEVELSLIGSSETDGGTYYGRIRLLPSNLDNCHVNGSPEIFKWRFSFRHKMNPLKVGLTWLLIILLAAFLIWMLVLKPMIYPRFGSIQKVFNIPGYAPLIIRFKGARLVELAASHQKKQSWWNRFWTGKIIYATHPAFVSPMSFKPSRGRRILTRVQAGTYHVMPNPMPGVGSATINDLRKNIRINVN